jgi:hypothetical protein
VAYSRYYPRICLEQLRETTNLSYDNRAEIRTKYLSNTSKVTCSVTFEFLIFFLICIVGGWNQGPLDTAAT